MLTIFWPLLSIFLQKNHDPGNTGVNTGILSMYPGIPVCTPVIPGMLATLHVKAHVFGGRLKYLIFWPFPAPIFSHCNNLWMTQLKYYFTYHIPKPKVYPGYTPCESQKQPKSANVEVQNCLEFNLASMYLANSCERGIEIGVNNLSSIRGTHS